MKTRHVVPWFVGLVLLAAATGWYVAPPSVERAVPPPGGARFASLPPPPPSVGQREAQPLRPPSLAAPLEPVSAEKSLSAFLADLAQAFGSADAAEQDFALDKILPALTAQDPVAVARLVVGIRDEALRDRALDRFARLWGAQDRPSAFAWADALPHRDERETALTGLCLQTATRSLSEAAETLSTYVPGDRPLGVLEDLTQKWAQAHFANARQWALTNQPGPRREGLVARLAFVQAKTDPATAAMLVIDEIPPGDAQNEAAISVLHQWAETDLPAASKWVNAFAPGPLRDRALRELHAIAPPNGSPTPP